MARHKGTMEMQWKAGVQGYAFHPSDAWVKVTIDSCDYVKESFVVKDKTSRKWKCKLSELRLSSLKAGQGVDDMISLDILHEGAIQDNVQTRYNRKEIYTYVGTILVSINPYETIENLYGEKAMQKHNEESSKRIPHLYGLSDRVYSQLMNTRTNQSILISGESGAGKTEATKHCLRYLTNRATKNGSFDGSNLITQCIISVNPVLESFGNARTKRNHNSSRFGKLIQVQYDEVGSIVGGHLKNYLLEKSRVVKAGYNERSYHIFYQLCRGLPEEMKTKLRLKDCSDHYYLNQSGCLDIEGVDDAADFKEVCSSLVKCGVETDVQENLFQILAAILHLGDLQFRSVSGAKVGDNDKSELVETDSLLHAATLLQVSPESLKAALCIRTMGSGRGSVYKIPLTCEKSYECRDALCKEIYSMLFDWTVATINKTLQGSAAIKNYIAVLDIFGFEVFEQNSFEQLCINYANEVLQQQFIYHYFHLEQEEYAREGLEIDLIKIEEVDNVHVLKLITSKPHSIFCILEEQCSMPKGSDANFIQRLENSMRKMSKESSSLISRVKTDQSCFQVSHFAGKVIYNSNGFLEKNKDPLHIDLQTLLSNSADKNKLMEQFLEHGSSSKRNMNYTVVKSFQKQVNHLMTLLDETEPNYVRCIKPNEEKAPQTFVGQLVLKQMSYSGLLDSIKIRQAGYSIRRTFMDIVYLFGNSTLGRKAQKLGPKKACEMLLGEMQVPESTYIMGKTKVFFKNTDAYAHILNHVNEIKARAAIVIQSAYRKVMERRKFISSLNAVHFLKRALVTHLRRKQFLRKKQAAVTIQKNVRCMIAKNEVKARKEDAALRESEEYKRKWINLQLCMEKASHKVRRKGWLYKKGGKGGGRRNWKKRYFVLMDDTLAYYEDEKLNGFKGRINLTAIQTIGSGMRPSFFFRDNSISRDKSDQYCLSLNLKDKPFFATSEQKEEVDEWVTSITLLQRLTKLNLEVEKSKASIPETPLEEIERWLTEIEIV